MTVGTAAVLDAARAVERDLDVVLRQEMFSNPLAVAWAEDRFDDGLSPEGTGRERPWPRWMAQLLDDRCDCWREEQYVDAADCADDVAVRTSGAVYLAPAPSSIPSEQACYLSAWLPAAHRIAVRHARMDRRRALLAAATTLDADDPATAARWRDLADLVESGFTDARARRRRES